MRSRRFLSSRAAQESDEPLVNLTPLIDVVFVVLIIFILIAPMLDVDKVQLASAPQPNEHTNSTLEESPITLHVREDNSIWFHKKKLSVEQLYPLLIQEKQRHPRVIPQLFHDKRASFGTYQSIKNAMESAGFTELDVILEPNSP
ncbi:MAG: biopolymer transporter ExbD [Chlamydiae bacterium]|nr:biopolymer transporter ExbD [Chlamydiota bacterium]